MLLAPVAGAATVGANTTAVDGEQLDNQLHSVSTNSPSGDFISLTDSVNVWEGSVFSLRVDREDDGVATSVENLEMIAENSQGSEFLRINNLVTFEEDATLDLTFTTDYVPGTTNEFDGTDMHVVAAKAESADDLELPTNLDVEAWKDFLEDGADSEDVTFFDVGEEEIDGGEASFDFDLSEADRGAGAYTFVAVRTLSGDGVVIDNGDMEIDGEIDILGSDVATAQQTDSDITVDDTHEIGDTIEFDVDPNLSTNDDKVEHAVALWDEDAVSDEELTIIAPDNLDSDTTLADFTIEHTIAEVNGVANMEDGVSAFGQSLDANQGSGTFELANLISFLANEGDFEEPTTERTDDTVIYASATSLETIDDGSTVIEVETTDDFEEGDYVAVHMAMADDDLTKTSSSRTDISLVDEIEDDPDEAPPDDDDDPADDDPADTGPGAPPPAPPDDDDEEEEVVEPEPEELDDDAIDEELDVPEDERPIRAQKVDMVFDPETGVSTATFTDDFPVESVGINAQVNGSVTAGEYEREPARTGPSPGTSAAVAQIAVPEGFEDTEGTVTNRIQLDRLEEIGADADDLQINRFADGEWQSLETVVVEETDTHVRIAADTPGFSFFSTSAVSEPTAAFDVIPASPEAGEEVTLDASESEDQYGEIVSFDWDVAGEELSGEEVTTTFDEGGEYEIELTVENDAGETDTVTETVTVTEPESFFEVTDLDAPAEAEFGDTLDVTATITNTGDATGEVTVAYEFDGELEDEEIVTLDADESETVSFSVTAPDVEETYEHTVSTDDDSQTVTTTVEQPPEDPPEDDDPPEDPPEDDDGISLLLLLGVVAILLGGAAAVYLITQRQS